MFGGLRRSIKLATTKAFRCPGCEKYVPIAKLRLAGKRGFCPHCGAVIFAPEGEPVGHVAGLAAPPEPPPLREGGVLATLGFMALALDGVLIFYLLWFSPTLLTAAIVEYIGLRPIGWEATATYVSALLATALFTALTFPAAVLATKRLPGLVGAVVALALAWTPVIAAHVLGVMPWETRASHLQSWPKDLSLSEFSVCAKAFSVGGMWLAARGPVALEIENQGRSTLREATFTIEAGRRPGWFGEETRHRQTIRGLAPGERRRISQDLGFGHIQWKNTGRLGGPNSAGAYVFWDYVEFEDGSKTLTDRPEAATIARIPDCKAVTRPALPWR